MVPTSVPIERTSFVGWAKGPVEGVRCDRPKILRLASGDIVSARCRRSDGYCEPCAVTYRRKVRRVASSGCLIPGRTYLLTLTAPGVRQHFLPSGVPCPCTPPGGVDLARWNGTAVDRWNDLSRALARLWGLERFEYFKAVEAQERGALHLHVLIRVPKPIRVRRGVIRALVVRHGYGHEVDLQEVDGARAAGYVAKYVAKSSSERRAVPFVHRQTGEVGPGRWRTWTASRSWGITMGAINEAQAVWWRSAAAVPADPEERRADGYPASAGPLDPNGSSYADVVDQRPMSGPEKPM